MGVTGLETAFAALHTELVCPGVLDLGLLVERMSAGAAPFGFEPPSARARRRGEPGACSTPRPSGRRAPRAGRAARRTPASPAARLRGRVLMTVAAGRVAYRQRSFAMGVA